jgi:hypothetical protein
MTEAVAPQVPRCETTSQSIILVKLVYERHPFLLQLFSVNIPYFHEKKGNFPS